MIYEVDGAYFIRGLQDILNTNPHFSKKNYKGRSVWIVMPKLHLAVLKA